MSTTAATDSMSAWEPWSSFGIRVPSAGGPPPAWHEAGGDEVPAGRSARAVGRALRRVPDQGQARAIAALRAM